MTTFPKCVVVGLSAALLTSVSASALAYGRPGHHRLPLQAWETMRAAVAGSSMYEGVSWNGQPPGTPAPDSPGVCASGGGNCGRAVSQAEWGAFVTEIMRSMMRLNTFENHVPLVDDCTRSSPGDGTARAASQQTPLSELQYWLSSAHFDLEDTSLRNCGTYPSPLPAGADRKSPATDGASPQGLFSRFSIDKFVEGNQNQGSVLGWHAKYRDDDVRESVLYGSPVTALAENTVEAGIAGIVLPIVCLVFLFEGRTDCLSEARKLANDADFAKALNDYLPHVGEADGESYIGFWHFIDVRGRAATYNELPGLEYDTAGPEGVPGALDQAIMVIADVSGLRIDANKSTGTNRYEVPNPDDGKSPTKHRDTNDWGRNNIGETEFSPLSNLAYYGFDHYKTSIQTGKPGVEWLGWPLHALGDATVPHHVAITTGHGHVPYEDWVDAHLDAIYFTQRGCTTNCDHDLLVQQFDQVHRILEHAFRFREYLKTHGVRDLITQVATETLNEIGGSKLAAWPFCDVCDVSYQGHGDVPDALSSAFYSWVSLTRDVSAQDPLPHKMITNPLGYYDDYLDNSRKLGERGVGATIAFLMSSSELACNVWTEPCTTAANCCSGYICNGSGTCEPEPGPN